MYNMFGRNYNEMDFEDLVRLGDMFDYQACVNEIDRFYKQNDNYELDGTYQNLMDKQKIEFFSDCDRIVAAGINNIKEADDILEVGVRYYEGQGVEKDYNKAYKYFNLVDKWLRAYKLQKPNIFNQSRIDELDSHFNRLSLYLTKCYFNGHGVEKDMEKGFKYFDNIFGDAYFKNILYLNYVSDYLGYRGEQNLLDLGKNIAKFIKGDSLREQYFYRGDLSNVSLYSISLAEMYTYGLLGDVDHYNAIYNYFREICYINGYIYGRLSHNYYENYSKEESNKCLEVEQQLHSLFYKIIDMSKKIYNELSKKIKNEENLYNLDLLKDFNKDVLFMDFDKVLELANNGNVTAMVKASYCYQIGGVVEENEKEWLKYATMAANKNELGSLIQVADNYIKYNEVKKGVETYKTIMTLTMNKAVNILINDFKSRGLEKEKQYIKELNDYIKEFEEIISYVVG